MFRGSTPEQQDEIFAEMQAAALVVFKGAATAADFASAVTAFSRAANARLALWPNIYRKRANERANKEAFAEMNRNRPFV